jgi:thiamine biosynthesis lipoprotein
VVRAVVLTMIAAAALAGAARADDAGVAAAAKKPVAHKIQYSDKAMGTIINVTIWTSDEAAAAKGAKAVFVEMHRLDDMMTTWRDSEMFRINAQAGKSAVKVSDETITVIDRALDVSAKSNGIFDITVGAFHGLWKFDEDMDGSLPDPAEVAKRLKLVNWKDVIVDHKKKTVMLRRAGMSITLGGIAKGYAVDRGVAIMKRLGFTSFIVQAGGDMYVAGDKDGAPWIVGIRDPRGPWDSSFAVAPIKDHSFSTSGDYERGFVKDGIRYHHILDPRDGQPARASRSVTVMAKDAFTADAWSKVLFILGADGAMDLVEKMPDFDAAWVDSKNVVHVSSGLKDKLKILRQPTDAP